MNVQVRRRAPDTAAGEIKPPRSSDLMQALAEIEARFHTQEWRVAGVPIWPLARVRWFFAEWHAHYATATAGTSAATGGAAAYAKKVFTGAWSAAKARWKDSPANDRGDGVRDVVLLSDGISFANLQGKWVERFCDPLIAASEASGHTSVLWTPLHTYHLPRLRRSQYVQPGIDRANVRGEVRARTVGVPVHLPDHERVLEWLRSRGFGTAAIEYAKLASDGCRVRALADFFHQRLVRIRPRLAFVVSYYSVEGMAFILACRECGVLSADLQHGVQGELHPAYAAWPRSSEHALLPDRFWVWSEQEAQVIARWSEGTRHAAIVGGNPWTEVWQPGCAWPGVEHALSRAKHLRSQADPRPVVLVTLQYGLSPAEQLDGLARLVRASAGRCEFWVRLHPAMLERREEVRRHLEGAGSFQLDECSDLPLHALLPFVDVHLTHSSSTVIEAAQFGIRSVLTSAYGAELFAPQIASGNAHVHEGSESDLVPLLERLAKDRSQATVATQGVASALRALMAEATPGRVRA